MQGAASLQLFGISGKITAAVQIEGNAGLRINIIGTGGAGAGGGGTGGGGTPGAPGVGTRATRVLIGHPKAVYLHLSTISQFASLKTAAGAGSLCIRTEGMPERARTPSGAASLWLGSIARASGVVTASGTAFASTKASGRISYIIAAVGSGRLVFRASGYAARLAAARGESHVFFIADGQPLRLRSLVVCVGMLLSADAQYVRVKFARGRTYLVIRTACGGFEIWQYERIALPGLILRPNDEIVIDTDKLTVTHNQQNAMRFVSRDSEFFLFNPGPNELTLRMSAGQAEMRILWKDAWL